MDNVNISIKPTYHEIASCNGCFARNFRAQGGGVGEYVQDLYDVRIGSFVACLCPKCLAVLQQQIGHTLRNRALPEVFAIVKGIDGTGARVIVKQDALTESIYTFESAADVQDFIFDTQAEAEARLVELTTHPVE